MVTNAQVAAALVAYETRLPDSGAATLAERVDAMRAVLELHEAEQPVERLRAVAGGLPGDWTAEYDQWTQPGTIRINSPKWGGVFLSKPKPGSMDVATVFYRLAADSIEAGPK